MCLRTLVLMRGHVLLRLDAYAHLHGVLCRTHSVERTCLAACRAGARPREEAAKELGPLHVLTNILMLILILIILYCDSENLHKSGTRNRDDIKFQR